MTYSFPDNFVSNILVSDSINKKWNGNEKWKMIKTQILRWKTKAKTKRKKNPKKVDESITKHHWTNTTDQWCKMIQNLDRRRNIEGYHFVRRTHS